MERSLKYVFNEYNLNALEKKCLVLILRSGYMDENARKYFAAYLCSF